MEQQHQPAKWSLYPENVKEEKEEEEEGGLQRRVSRPVKNVSKDVGEESDSSSSRSCRVRDVKERDNATNYEIQVEPERELEPEKETDTDKVLTNEGIIAESVMGKTEVEFHDDGSKCLDSGNRIRDEVEKVFSEETQFDVERVLEKQNTHNLFCPNCHSCITGRVILRRKEEDYRQDPNQNEGQEVFGCLSCFSFFIPTGNGFKLFEMFESKGEAQKATDQQDIPVPEGQMTEQGNAVTENNLPHVGIPMPEENQSSHEAQDTRDWDILKSVVYGGLVESITSLGIVSSAAGGGAKTLNTLALGLANLISGLFVIAHNLRELKGSSRASSESAVQDRYFEQLGRRDNFWLHATVAIISFIIFGSVAPITYAFSFRESDNRDYKLAVVAAASLFCILMLAIGKAHVRIPPRSYFKTISYYVTMGITASGFSFLVGELVYYLLEKLGWFDSSSTVTGAIVEKGTTGSGWASY